MTVTRTVAVAGLLLAARCAPPAPSSPEPPAARIAAPAPGAVLDETYPADASPSDRVKRAVWARINSDRADAGLAALAWDEAASRVADAFCAEQVAERTRGHFLRDGVPPYARTGLAGVFGYQSENSASWTTTSTAFEETPTALALSSHRAMLEEKPPNDGHRRAILDPEATHVGVGWAMGSGRFHLSQEFFARGLDRLSVRTDARGAAVRFEGRSRPPWRLRFVTVAREPIPRPLSREEASARTSYRYPTPAEAFVFQGQKGVRVVGALTDDRLQPGPDRAFSFLYSPAGAGLYVFVFWLGRTGVDPAAPLGSAVVRVEPAA